MLLGNALALAFELGVFDTAPDANLYGVETHRPDRGSLSYLLRSGRVQKLLYVYITQLAGRLEWTPMVANLSSLKNMNQRFDVPSPSSPKQQRNRGNSRGEDADGPPSLRPDNSIDETILDCWIGITDLMKSGNQSLFPSRAVTRDLIRTGRYVELLETFTPRIGKWLTTFSKLKMPEYIRFVLRIEFEYVRVYINSLALQAVVERCTSNVGIIPAQSDSKTTSSDTASGNATQPNAGQRDRHGSVAFSTLMGVQDQEYIKEVVDASRNLLRTVVEGLLPGDYLKHCPVRTYLYDLHIPPLSCNVTFIDPLLTPLPAVSFPVPCFSSRPSLWAQRKTTWPSLCH